MTTTTTTPTPQTPSAAPDQPAILGGASAVTRDQSEANRWPIITSEDEQAVLDVLRSGHLSIHPVVDELENDYRAWLGSKFALAHNNGTGALHAAMHAIDLKPGEEVIVPSATWWASVMPILHQGGIPVFAETERQCIGLDPQDVEAKITPRTRAIMVVHLFGMPSRMNELLEIAKKHNLRVIEDASHAHGATYHGRKIGTLGDIGCFSMQGNKLVPSAEGGMLLTDDQELYERAVRYGHYERLLPMTESKQRYFAATGFGHKFRMSPLSAAVARVQLRHLQQRNAKRNDNCIYLSKQLEELGFETFLAPDDVERVYFEFLIRCTPQTTTLSPELLARALQAEGAQVGAPRYPLLHQQPMFTHDAWRLIARIPPEMDGRTYDPATLPRTIEGNAQLIKLPGFPNADHDLLDQYASAFRKVVTNADRIAQESA